MNPDFPGAFDNCFEDFGAEFEAEEYERETGNDYEEMIAIADHKSLKLLRNNID